MSVWASVAAVLATAAVATAAGAGALAAPAGASVDSLRYHEASVFVDGGPGELVGSVNVRSVVGGEVSVAVFLSSAEPITCPDGSDDVRNETLRTEVFYATEPGPVTLDVDPRLRTAHGEAVVDLVHSVTPGCGAEETETLLPAQTVSVDVTGRTELIRARMTGSVSAGNAFDRSRVSSLSRDGTGSAVVGSLVDAASDASWLKYGVEHVVRRGTTPQVPENPAPEGGRGAMGAASAFYDPPGGLGTVYEDAVVVATIDAPPGKEMTLWGSIIAVSAVRCEGGEVGMRFSDAVGTTTAPVVIGPTLGSAQATGTATMTEVVYDSCTDTETTRAFEAPIALALTATGPAVRVRDSYYFSAPPAPVERLKGWSVRREAAGTITVDTFTAPTDLGSIARASR